MIQKMVVLLGTLFAFAAYGQTYSYSFEGNIDQNSIELIQKSGIQLNQVEQFKVRYKEDSERGELLIVITKSSENRAESDNQFNVVEVKSLLINHGLSPLNVIKLND